MPELMYAEPPPICPYCKVPMVRYSFNRWQYLKMGADEYRCPKCHRVIRKPGRSNED